jgi:urea transport system substrate-binding protein
LVVAGLLALVVFWGPWGKHGGVPAPSGEPIRIGVLHSETGTMEYSERPIRDAIQLAVEEINEQGGLLGRPVEIVSEDGESDEVVFAKKAEKLITEDKVCTIFGCWTSASRKAVKEVVERHNHLLVYSVQYEGLEQSPNIIYTGAVPNQQILPALQWFRGFRAKRTRWILVGSDYVFPRAANRIIRHEAEEQLGVTIVGEEYVRFGEQELGKLMEKVAAAKPDLIVNTLNGDSNVAFFRALAKFGKDKPATLSFSVAEHELRPLDGSIFRDDYAAWNYFMSIKSEANEAFLRRYAAKYGVRRRVSDPMQTSYASVHLWAQAVRAAGSTDVAAIREAMKGQRYDAPQGPMTIDPVNGHTTQYVRIGRITEEGLFTVVYTSEGPISPEPFPAWQTKAEWQEFLEGLRRRWHGRWSAPAK